MAKNGSKRQKNDTLQAEMTPTCGVNGVSAPGSAARPGRTKASADVGQSDRTPTSISSSSAYDRAYGSLGKPGNPTRRGY